MMAARTAVFVVICTGVPGVVTLTFPSERGRYTLMVKYVGPRGGPLL